MLFILDCTFRYNWGRNRFAGGLLLYINENIASRSLNQHPKFPDLALTVFELHQSKCKWLIKAYITTMGKWYWDSKLNKFNLRSLLKKTWKHHSDCELWFTHYQYTLRDYPRKYNLSNLINISIHYQSNNPTCIGLILNSKRNLFKLSDTFEIGLSDHHKLISVIQKSWRFKGKHKEKIYRSYRQFKSESFKKDLEFRLNHLTSSVYDDF